MHSYAALLGHLPHISIAELSAMFPDFSLQFSNNAVAVFETKEKIDQNTQNTLGGTILFAKQLTRDSVDIEDVPQMIYTELKDAKGKATFSLRADGVPPKSFRSLYRDCKNYLKERDIASRYIGNEKKPALPVQLHDNDMLESDNGCEIVMIRHKKDLWIGKTITAQDTKAYSERDVGKPVRDTTVGLLPPKLAQILLNFGMYALRESTKKMPKDVVVFDPFCGTGVIPLEAMLQGMQILGSDLSPKAVKDSEKNIEWLRKKYDIKKKDVPSTIWKQDAKKDFTLKEQPHVIVTETTLGPGLRKRPLVKEAEKIKKDMELLQIGFIENVAQTLPNVPIVMTWPVWYTKAKPVLLEQALKTCDALGYRRILPPGIDPTFKDRTSILYRRKDQFVGREILILLPKT